MSIFRKKQNLIKAMIAILVLVAIICVSFIKKDNKNEVATEISNIEEIATDLAINNADNGAVFAKDGGVINEFKINTYFERDNNDKIGVVANMSEKLNLHIHIDTSNSFTGTIKNLKAQLGSNLNHTVLLPGVGGQVAKSENNKIEFKDFDKSGNYDNNIIMEQNVITGGNGSVEIAHENKLSANNTITYTGEYIDANANIRKFEKVVTYHIDWTGVNNPRDGNSININNVKKYKKENGNIIVNYYVVMNQEQNNDKLPLVGTEWKIDNLKINNIEPVSNGIKVVTTGLYETVCDINYNSTSGALTFKTKSSASDYNNVALSGGHGAIVSIEYPNSVKETNILKQYNLTAQLVSLAPNCADVSFPNNPTSIISGTRATGRLYSDSKYESVSITFDNNYGEIYRLDSRFEVLNKYNTLLMYKNINTEATLSERNEFSVNIGGGYTKKLTIIKDSPSGQDVGTYLTGEGKNINISNYILYNGISIPHGIFEQVDSFTIYGSNDNWATSTPFVFDKDRLEETRGYLKDSNGNIQSFKKVKVEFTDIKAPINSYVDFIAKINNEELARNISITDFRNCSTIGSTTKLYVTDEDRTSHTCIEIKPFTADYKMGDYNFKAVREHQIEKIETSIVKHSVQLSVETANDGWASKTYWKNPVITLVIPKEFADSNIEDITIGGKSANYEINNPQKVNISGKLYETVYKIKINRNFTIGDCPGIDIKIKLTPSETVMKKSEIINETKIQTYVYNSLEDLGLGDLGVEKNQIMFNRGYWVEEVIDKYDADMDEDTTDTFFRFVTNVKFKNPAGIYTNTAITATNKYALCPDSVILNKTAANSEATIDVNVYNYSNTTINKIQVIGNIPLKDNKNIGNNSQDYYSNFSTTMKNTGINLNLSDSVNTTNSVINIYYSTLVRDETDIDALYSTPSSNNIIWKKAENVTDWSRIKSYFIEITNIDDKAFFKFQYKVVLPSSISYGMQSFANHMLLYNLSSGDKVEFRSPISAKTGIQIRPDKMLNLNIEKVDKNDTTKYLEATFMLKRTDELPIGYDEHGNPVFQKEGITTNSNSTRKKIEGLYPDTEYILKETKTPASYITKDAKFTIVESQNSYNLTENENVKKTSDYTCTDDDKSVLINGAQILNEKAVNAYKIRYFYQEYGSKGYPSECSQEVTVPSATIGTKITLSEINTNWKDHLPRNLSTDHSNEFELDISKSTQYITIKENEENIFNVYFKRIYTIRYYDNKVDENIKPGNFITETYKAASGSLTPKFKGDTTCYSGYTFVGWWTEETYETNDHTWKNTVEQDTNYFATWKATTAQFKVRYHYELPGGIYVPTAHDSAVKEGETGQLVTKYLTSEDLSPQNKNKTIVDITTEIKDTWDYELDTRTNLQKYTGVTISGDGDTVIDIYFRRLVKVTYKPGEHGTFSDDIHSNKHLGEEIPGFKGNLTGQPGYTFVKWVDENGKEKPENGVIDDDKVFTAVFEKTEGIEYRIDYYYQNKTNGNYVKRDSKTKTGRKGEVGQVDLNHDVTPRKDIAGDYKYVFAENNSNNVLSGTITVDSDGNGTLVLKVYYKLRLTVTYTKGERGTFDDEIHEVDFRAPRAYAAPFKGKVNGKIPVTDGYIFRGWLNQNTNSVIADNETSELITDNVIYRGIYSVNNGVSYTINYYFQNELDGTYPEDDSPSCSIINNDGTTDELMQLSSEDKNPNLVDPSRTGYELNTDISDGWANIIKGDGSTVFKVYFKKVYKIKYTTDDPGTFNDQVYPAYWNDNTPEFQGTKTAKPGYEFDSWNDNVSEKVTADKTYKAIWRPIDVTYKIAYHYQKETGIYAPVPDGYTELTAKTGTIIENDFSAYTIPNPSQFGITGNFVFDNRAAYNPRAVYSNDESRKISGDGTTVFDVFFRRVYEINYVVGENGKFPGTTTKSAYHNDKTPRYGFSQAAEVKPGYTFAKWLDIDENATKDDLDSTEYGVHKTVLKDTTYNAVFLANTNTPYTIEYYYEDINGEGSGSYAQISKRPSRIAYGTTDTEATLTRSDLSPTGNGITLTNQYELSMNEYHINERTGIINGDGSTVLRVYFKRKYRIRYLKGTKGTFATQTYYRIIGSATPEFTGEKTCEVGYTFDKWLNGTKVVSQSVTGDVDYVAQWLPIDVKYTIKYFYQNDSENSYNKNEPFSTEELIAKTDQTVSVPTEKLTPAKDESKYVFDADNSTIEGIVKGDGSLVLEVCFKRRYTIKYLGGAHPGTDFVPKTYTDLFFGNKTPKYSESNVPPAELGYKFTGWLNEETNTSVPQAVTKDATYTAQWIERDDIDYTVEYYYEDVNGIGAGSYSKIAQRPDVVRQGIINTAVTVTNDDKEPEPTGVVLDHKYMLSMDEEHVLARNGTIKADGSTKLKVYFKKKYVVRYVGGLHPGSSFRNQTHETTFGSKTPDYQGQIDAAPGYSFVKWLNEETNSNVSQVVTTDVTYTAQWRANIDTPYHVEWYYELDGAYPNQPYAKERRTGTTDTTVSVTNEDKIPKRTDGNWKLDTTKNGEWSGNLDGEGTRILKVYFKEIPVNYNINLTLKNTKPENTEGTFMVTKQGRKNANVITVFNNDVNNSQTEIIESKVLIDTYTYKIKQTGVSNNKLVNILDKKYIDLTVSIGAEGTLDDEIAQRVVIRNDDGSKIDTEDPIYDYVDINISESQSVKTINVTVKNPVKYIVEVNKKNTDNEPLKDTQISITSPIIDEQNYEHENEKISGIESITSDGVVTGTTDKGGEISYEETWVDANKNNSFYTYVIKELNATGSQYVNILEDCELYVRVRVEGDGKLVLVDKIGRPYAENASHKFTIEKDGVEMTDYYGYVNVCIDTSSNSIKTSLRTDITNPVRYNLNVKSLYSGTLMSVLRGTDLKVIREKDNKKYAFENQSNISQEPMDAGEYVYYITESNIDNKKFLNVLENKYIKLKIRVEADGKVTIIDRAGNPNTSYFEIYEGDIEENDKSNHRKIEDENINKYIVTEITVAQNGIYSVMIGIRNPLHFELDILPKDTNNNFISGLDYTIYRQNGNINTVSGIEGVEKVEEPIDVGTYEYYITQNNKKSGKFVNVLENKYIKITVNVSNEGVLTIQKTEIYNGNIGGNNNTLDDINKYTDFINVSVTNNAVAMDRLNIEIKNPVAFIFEVNKKDTNNQPLANTEIEIVSPIINEQNHELDNNQIEGIVSIDSNGKINGKTSNQGKVSYEETYVIGNNNQTDYYTYKIKETKTAGPQYVNILENCELVIRVHVNADGTIKLVNKQGVEFPANEKYKFTIEDANGHEQNDYYEFISVDVDNATNAIKTTVNTEIVNPVRYNLEIKGVNTAKPSQVLQGVKFKAIREGVSNAVYVSDESGLFSQEESPMKAGLYTYYISETKKPNEKYINVLENKYIKINIKVERDGRVNILNASGSVDNNYYEIYEGNIDNINKVEDKKIEGETIKEFIKINCSDSNNDGLYDINVIQENPIHYEVDLDVRDTENKFISTIDFKVKRQEKIVYFDEVVEQTEIEETPIRANVYEYYITQNNTKNERFVNVLKDKFLKVTLSVGADGLLTKESVKIFKGDMDRLEKAEEITTGNIFRYFSVEIDNKSVNELSKLNIKVVNPVAFIMEVDKIDSADNPLSGTQIQINSEIINEQNYEFDNEKISGIENISNDGTVIGTTSDTVDNGIKARVSYEETWVDANNGDNPYYTYVISEKRISGPQYVNILEGFEIVVRAKVDAEGNLTLVNAEGLPYSENEKYKFTIRATGNNAVTDDIYTYVNVEINNNSIKAVLNSQIENPVRYNIAVHQQIYGEEKVDLAGIPVEIVSGFSGKRTVVTGENGWSIFEESPVRANEYDYMFTQLNEYNGVKVEDEFVNKLDGYCIGVRLNVHSDGVIKTLTDDEDETTVTYKLYKNNKGNYEEVNLEETKVDDFVKVKVTKDENNICTLNVYMITPEKHNFKLIKTDIDTMFNMNDVKFGITPKDSQGNEISYKSAITEGFDKIETGELFTKTIEDIEGIIDINDILIEKVGTYTININETTPIVEGMIYKDKSEDIIVRYEIVVENGKYLIKNMKITQAERYTIKDSTKLLGNETQTICVNVLNERIKGKYDLVLNKINKYTQENLDGAVYKVTVSQEGIEEKILYISDGNVLSMNPIIPYTGNIENNESTYTENIINNNGILTFKDIRIEIPESYEITIEELKAPDTFTKLDDIIKLKITTGIEGEYDDARYELKEVEIDAGYNHDLVTKTNGTNDINVRIENEFFDLSLRQFVSKVGGIKVNRAPKVDLNEMDAYLDTTAKYLHSKNMQRAYANQEIIYTIRVYNEGMIDGYCEEITQYLPLGLEFVDDEFNKNEGWEFIDSENKVVTRKLSKEVNENNCIKAYDHENKKIYSKDVLLKLKVASNIKLKSKLTTIAEITKSLAEDRKETVDRDSISLIERPTGVDLVDYKDDEMENEYVCGQEDDDDFEKLIIEEFDLAVVKYLKQLNNNILTQNIPKESLDFERMNEYENGIYHGFKYKHSNEIPKVEQNDKLIYGIRIYNEGSVKAYANEVIDTIPSGLELVQDSEINKKYDWIMLDENKNKTSDVQNAKYITTYCLSKNQEKEPGQNIINELIVNDKELKIDYKEIEVEFKVVEPHTNDRLVANEAEVSKSEDDLGLNVVDIDKIEKNREHIETVYVKSFDLAVKKEIVNIDIVNKSNGKVTKFSEEPLNTSLAKVDLEKNKLNKSDIIIDYNITISNVGETAGYAEEIIDVLPEGLKLVEGENPDWRLEGGYLVTNKYAEYLLEPGESKTITLKLVTEDSNKVGEKVNVVELTKFSDKNKNEVIDLNDIPGNNTDEATTVISIKTGDTQIFVLTVMFATLVLGFVVVCIIKKYEKE